MSLASCGEFQTGADQNDSTIIYRDESRMSAKLQLEEINKLLYKQISISTVPSDESPDIFETAPDDIVFPSDHNTNQIDDNSPGSEEPILMDAKCILQKINAMLYTNKCTENETNIEYPYSTAQDDEYCLQDSPVQYVEYSNPKQKPESLYETCHQDMIIDNDDDLTFFGEHNSQIQEPS